MTYPLALTGEYVEGEYDGETGLTGPSYVLVRVNGQEAIHLPSEAGWISAQEQQWEIQQVFIDFLRAAYRAQVNST